MKISTQDLVRDLKAGHIEHARFALVAHSDPDFFVLSDMKSKIMRIEDEIKSRAHNGDQDALAVV